MRRSETGPHADPDALEESVAHYEATTLAIENAARDLMATLVGGSGLTVDALGEQAREAASVLRAAHERYEGTTGALRDYVVELRGYCQAADAAGAREDEARALVQRADADLDDAASALYLARVSSGDQALIEQCRDEWEGATRFRRSALEELDEALRDGERALAALDAAADAAADRIADSFDGTNDDFWDEVRGLADAVTDWAGALAGWVLGFLKEVLDTVLAAVGRIVLVIAATLAVLALVAVLIAVVAVAVQIAVAIIESLLVIGVVLTQVVRTANVAADMLGLGDADRMRLVLTAILATLPLLSLFVVSRLANEARKPTPAVTRLDPGTVASGTATNTLADLDGVVPDSVDDLLMMAGQVDLIGRGERAVVDIAKVTRDDGSVAWIVTLPSTKDWVLGGDKGAPNDLDADLMLMLFPELRTQYERGVLEAMRQAAIPLGAPVLLVGWSLGGILGGHLIGSGAGGYAYGGLVCAGSPIDHMAIPGEVPVLQVKHTYDAVHRADMIDYPEDTASHVSLWDGERSGIGLDAELSPIAAHDNALYIATLQAHLRQDDSASVMFAGFYGIDDPATAAVPRVEHTQYAFAE